MIVNLNVKCKVTLNELGKQAWLSQFHNLPDDFKEAHPEILTTLEGAIDKNNDVEAALWEIMAIFGPYFSMTQSPFDRPSIELNKNPDFVKKVTNQQ
jgi:hypothetical protein